MSTTVDYNIAKLYNVGWSVDFLRKINTNHLSLEGVSSDFLQSHPPQTLLRLLTPKEKIIHGETVISSSELLLEANDYWDYLHHNFPETLNECPRIRDLFQYRNWLFKAKVKVEPSYPLPINEEVKLQIGGKFEGFDVVFPSETATLKEWGFILDHCVGAYGLQVKLGSSVVFSLNQGSVPVYTVEVIPSEGEWLLNQFMGYKNNSPPDDLYLKMTEIFRCKDDDEWY